MNRQEPRALLLASAQFVVVLDASIVNVALPSIGRTSTRGQPVLGDQRLRARLRRLPAARRPARRPPRPPARLRRRPDPLRRRLVASAVSPPTRASSSPRGRSRASAARCCRPRRSSILINTFAEGSERNRALGVWGAVAGSGGAVGDAARRRAHRDARLGVGAVRQHAGLPRASPSARAACWPRAATRPRPRLDVAGAVTDHGRPRHPRSTRSSTPPTPAGARPRRSA